MAHIFVAAILCKMQRRVERLIALGHYPGERATPNGETIEFDAIKRW